MEHVLASAVIVGVVVTVVTCAFMEASAVLAKRGEHVFGFLALLLSYALPVIFFTALAPLEAESDWKVFWTWFFGMLLGGVGVVVLLRAITLVLKGKTEGSVEKN